jgi:hypothetical protein
MYKELQTTADEVRKTAIPVPVELSPGDPVVIAWYGDYMEILTGWDDTTKVHNAERFKADFDYLLGIEK